MRTEDDIKKRIAAALAEGQPTGVDLAGYPVDVQEILQVVCELWHLRPPRTKQSKAYWIQSARELLDACGEYCPDYCLRAYRREFESYMSKNNGLAPFRVEGPGSLVKSIRAIAGELRSRESRDSRRRYVEGELSDFIEH